MRFSVKEDTLEDLDSMRAVRLRYTAAGSSMPHLAPALSPALSGVYLNEYNTLTYLLSARNFSFVSTAMCLCCCCCLLEARGSSASTSAPVTA